MPSPRHRVALSLSRAEHAALTQAAGDLPLATWIRRVLLVSADPERVELRPEVTRG
jgi:hypothetical protein